MASTHPRSALRTKIRALSLVVTVLSTFRIRCSERREKPPAHGPRTGENGGWMEFRSIFMTEGVPSVKSVHAALGMISNNLHVKKHFSIDTDSNEEMIAEHFSWVDKLTPREADTIGLHMLTYLFV